MRAAILVGIYCEHAAMREHCPGCGHFECPVCGLEWDHGAEGLFWSDNEAEGDENGWIATTSEGELLVTVSFSQSG